MVVDPFTALGLAGNIVQFIDFTCKLVTETRTIYRSATGRSEEHHVLDVIATDLSRLSDNLTISSSQGASTAGSELRGLALECKSVSDELLRALNSLKRQGKKTKWRSFTLALEEVWRKDHIQGIASRLDRLQQQFNTRLLKDMRDEQSDIRTGLQAVEHENKRLELNRVQDLQKLKQEVLGAIWRLDAKQELQTTTIENHLRALGVLQPVNPGDIKELSKKMKELSTAFNNIAHEGKTIAAEQTLLRSLSFKTMRVRQANVVEAQPGTFNWIFHAVPDQFPRPLRFDKWLESQNGIYWIRGKAGSGKSTLMKFLHKHKETEKRLTSWAGVKRLVRASYFFWNAGNRLQKSQEGLLRSLLFEILRQCPDLISQVCSKYAEYAPYQDDLYSWTRAELLDAFNLLLKQSFISVKFCFFIGGLDEYDVGTDSEHGELVKILQGFANSADVKLCVSSRPWNVFDDAFGQDESRYLKLEDLTRDDIRRYVKQNLEQHKRFRELQAKDERYPQLVAEIVTKAQGVFLWVFLVVRSLSQGLINADKVSDLQRRLSQLPEDLNMYFKHMLDSVEAVYKAQTAQAFQFAIEAAEPLSLMTFSFLDDEDSDFAIGVKIEPLSDADIRNRREDVRKRLDARCKGLLEVTENPNPQDLGPFFVYKGRFPASDGTRFSFAA